MFCFFLKELFHSIRFLHCPIFLPDVLPTIFTNMMMSMMMICFVLHLRTDLFRLNKNCVYVLGRRGVEVLTHAVSMIRGCRCCRLVQRSICWCLLSGGGVLAETASRVCTLLLIRKRAKLNISLYHHIFTRVDLNRILLYSVIL